MLFITSAKSGNRAVHGDEEETVEEALGVLSDLHYVAGETASCIFWIDKKISIFWTAKLIFIRKPNL